MKRQPDEDLILQAAFGEADASALAQVNASLSSDAGLAREFESLKQMKDALKDLKEVPECQLSIDRVRDAILSRSVRPQRRAVWLWPSLVGAAATALVLVLLSQEAPQQSIASPSRSVVVAQTNPVPSNMEPLQSQPTVEPEQEAPVASNSRQSPAPPRYRPSRSTVAMATVSLVDAAPISFDPQPDEIVLRGARWHSESERPAESVVQIVEVGDETDSGTGMRIATDKNKHDVAIGG